MYNERNRVSEEIKGDSTDRQLRQVIHMLEDLRAQVRTVRQLVEKENA